MTCPNCDRAECPEPPAHAAMLAAKDTACTIADYLAGGSVAVTEAAYWQARKDCAEHRQDWRARALRAEQAADHWFAEYGLRAFTGVSWALDDNPQPCKHGRMPICRICWYEAGKPEPDTIESLRLEIKQAHEILSEARKIVEHAERALAEERAHADRLHRVIAAVKTDRPSAHSEVVWLGILDADYAHRARRGGAKEDGNG